MKVLAIILIVIVVLAILYFLMIMPRMAHKPDTACFKEWLYAHRGLHDNATQAPENSMAAQILTPVLSGFLLENVSYNTLFPYALFFSLMAFLTMTQVRHGDVKPQKKESILENFDVDD